MTIIIIHLTTKLPFHVHQPVDAQRLPRGQSAQHRTMFCPLQGRTGVSGTGPTPGGGLPSK